MTKSRTKRWRDFNEAREYARDLGLKSSREWQEWSKSGKRPSDIPANPYGVYRDEWGGWPDWLGSGIIGARNREYQPFKEARDFVRSLGLKSSREWQEWSKGVE